MSGRRDEPAGDGHRCSRHQPLQLGAAYSGRAPIAGYLRGDPRDAKHEDAEEEHVLVDAPPRPCSRRVILEQKVAGRIDVHPARSDRVDGDAVRGHEPDHASHAEAREPESPAPRRHRAVREQQDRQREARDSRRPRGLQQDCDVPERQAPVMLAVVENRIRRRGVIEGETECAAEQYPAHRVPRLPAGHDEADDCEPGNEDHRTAVAGAELVIGDGERDRGQRQQDDRDAERASHRRRCQSACHAGNLDLSRPEIVTA